MATATHGCGSAGRRRTAVDGRNPRQTHLWCAIVRRWQELFGVVEVPEGAGRLLILLWVEDQNTAEDVVWFDDVELYRLAADGAYGVR